MNTGLMFTVTDRRTQAESPDRFLHHIPNIMETNGSLACQERSKSDIMHVVGQHESKGYMICTKGDKYCQHKFLEYKCTLNMCKLPQIFI